MSWTTASNFHRAPDIMPHSALYSHAASHTNMSHAPRILTGIATTFHFHALHSSTQHTWYQKTLTALSVWNKRNTEKRWKPERSLFSKFMSIKPNKAEFKGKHTTSPRVIRSNRKLQTAATPVWHRCRVNHFLTHVDLPHSREVLVHARKMCVRKKRGLILVLLTRYTIHIEHNCKKLGRKHQQQNAWWQLLSIPLSLSLFEAIDELITSRWGLHLTNCAWTNV